MKHSIRLCALLAAGAAAQTQAPQADLYVFVGPANSITVTIPLIAKEDLIEIVSTFFIPGQEKRREDLRATLRKASEVTIVVTTGRVRRRP